MSLIGILMAGGKSSRFNTMSIGEIVEKQLIEFQGRKLIDIAVDAIMASKVTGWFVAVSPNVPKTITYCRKMKYSTLHTSGKDYHTDIMALLRTYKEFVSVSTDLPFLKAEHIDRLIDSFVGRSVTGVIPVDMMICTTHPNTIIPHEGRCYVPVGLNIVTSSEISEMFVFDDPLIGINVNSMFELGIADDANSAPQPTGFGKK